MRPLRWLYLSRQFNRSGYSILKHLLEQGDYLPCAVLLPKTSQPNPLDDPSLAQGEIDRYIHEVAHYVCRPLRFLHSIRLLAERNGIQVYERETIKDDDCFAWLQTLAIDLIVLGGGWPELIPGRVINLPRLGIINTHPSLLPKFRGTDVHRWQVFHGVSHSGCSIHYIDEFFDTGPILGQADVDVLPSDTPQELAEKTAQIAGPIMSEVLEEIVAADPKRLEGITQSARNDSSHYFSRWRWSDRDFLKIDWTRPAREISRFVLACTQESYRYNGPFFAFRGAVYILREAETVLSAGIRKPGDVIKTGKEVIVCCAPGNEALRLVYIQPIQIADWDIHCHKMPALPANVVIERQNIQTGDNLLSDFV